MILKRKATSAPYQDFYPDAILKFESSSNDAVNKVRSFTFRAYPSINHTNRPCVGQLVLSFTQSSSVATIFNDGVKDFEFNNTFNGYVDVLGNPYTPQAQPSIVQMGYPNYNTVGLFVDETGDKLVFKNPFAQSWLFAQEFDSVALGNDWEII